MCGRLVDDAALVVDDASGFGAGVVATGWLVSAMGCQVGPGLGVDGEIVITSAPSLDAANLPVAGGSPVTETISRADGKPSRACVTRTTLGSQSDGSFLLECATIVSTNASTRSDPAITGLVAQYDCWAETAIVGQWLLWVLMGQTSVRRRSDLCLARVAISCREICAQTVSSVTTHEPRGEEEEVRGQRASTVVSC